MAVVVTGKGRVTIPKPVRDHLGIGPGSLIEFEWMPDGRVAIVKVGHARPEPDRFASLRGHAGKGPSTDEIMILTRGE